MAIPLLGGGELTPRVILWQYINDLRHHMKEDAFDEWSGNRKAQWSSFITTLLRYINNGLVVLHTGGGEQQEGEASPSEAVYCCLLVGCKDARFRRINQVHTQRGDVMGVCFRKSFLVSITYAHASQ